jgi:RNase P protein component
MKLTNDERTNIVNSIQLNIDGKEIEILEAEQRTYVTLTTEMGNKFRRNRIKSLEKEIFQLKELSRKINSLDNMVLVLPSDIRLNISSD